MAGCTWLVEDLSGQAVRACDADLLSHTRAGGAGRVGGQAQQAPAGAGGLPGQPRAGPGAAGGRGGPAERHPGSPGPGLHCTERTTCVQHSMPDARPQGRCQQCMSGTSSCAPVLVGHQGMSEHAADTSAVCYVLPHLYGRCKRGEEHCSSVLQGNNVSLVVHAGREALRRDCSSGQPRC